MIADAAPPSPEQMQRAVVLTSRDLALPGALRALRLLDERAAAPAKAADGSSRRHAIDAREVRRTCRGHLLRQRRARNAEQPRGRGLIAARDLERERHGLALDVLEQLAPARNANVADRIGRALLRRASLNHQMLGAHDRRIGAQDRRALDDVLQLANIPRPAVHEKRGDRVAENRLRLLCSRVSSARK